MPAELDAQVDSAARRAGMTYSAWLAAVAQKEFTVRAGLNAVAAFQREHGAFSPDELAEAEQWAAGAVERARATKAAEPRTA